MATADAFLASTTSATLPIGIDGADGGGTSSIDVTADSAGGVAIADAASGLDGNANDAAETESGARCEAGAGAAVSPDAAACFIDLSQYDRSCSIDSDCVSNVDLNCAPTVYIRGGNFCNGCNCNTGTAINRSAVAQYVADVSGTPEGSGQVAFPVCNCPPTPPAGAPLCVNGSCWPGLADSGSGD